MFPLNPESPRDYLLATPPTESIADAADRDDPLPPLHTGDELPVLVPAEMPNSAKTNPDRSPAAKPATLPLVGSKLDLPALLLAFHGLFSVYKQRIFSAQNTPES